MSWLERAVQAVEAQQEKVKEHSAPWMVGEQLKDICRMEPASAELIAQDLGNESMSIVEAEKKIKAYADSHKTGNSSCVPPVESDRILREFYGLASRESGPGGRTAPAGGNMLNLADFL